MERDQALRLVDELTADQDRRAAILADERRRGVMSFVCGRCGTPNAYWRSKCLSCDEPALTFGVGWPD